MHNPEKALLKEASQEIKNLRRQNELLSARLGGFDDALLLLRTPALSPGYALTEDLTWKIDKHLAVLEAEEKRTPMAAPVRDREESTGTLADLMPRRQ